MSYCNRSKFNRSNPLSGWTKASAVTTLIVANAIVFVIQTIFAVAYNNPVFNPFSYYFSLTPQLITTKFFIWQLVTSMFMHADIMHILFNMLGLYFFGRELEWIWGKGKFLTFYFITGLLANIFVYVLNIHQIIPTLGASGAVLALLGAYAALYPDRIVILYMFPVKVKWIAVGYVVFSIYGLLGLGGGGVAHAAHLAGIVLGVAYIKVHIKAFDNIYYDVKERIRLWKLRRKYKNFRVVDKDVKKMWDDLEDRINKDDHPNTHIN